MCDGLKAPSMLFHFLFPVKSQQTVFAFITKQWWPISIGAGIGFNSGDIDTAGIGLLSIPSTGIGQSLMLRELRTRNVALLHSFCVLLVLSRCLSCCMMLDKGVLWSLTTNCMCSCYCSVTLANCFCYLHSAAGEMYSWNSRVFCDFSFFLFVCGI